MLKFTKFPAAPFLSAATQPQALDPDSMVAALDLGSNSFHLIVASLAQGRLRVVDRIKDMVRLAAALDPDNTLNPARAQPALQALERYGERLRMLPPGNVHAVATNTLRKARNADSFLRAAEHALGHRVHVISGREEARLIYVGVAHTLAPSHERRLVVDIGGGSTEVVLGRRVDPGRCESLYMGCVEMTARFMADGRISARRFEAARLHAMQELESIASWYHKGHWDVALGASGTIRSVHNTCRELGFTDEAITREGLAALRQCMLECAHVDALRLPGLAAVRRPVFPGGLAILTAVFDALEIDRMLVSRGALREGLLYELIGRIDRVDVCEHTINDIQSRYDIDRNHAQRVLDTAMFLFVELSDGWQLDPGHAALLARAASLHELGLMVSHGQYHKHGAYLVANMDMPGFSRSDQARIAAMIRAHRRKFPLEDFDAFGDAEGQTLIRLAVLLRIATLLHRSRSEQPLPLFRVEGKPDGLTLQFPDGWLDEHPLTRLDLDQERDYLAAIGFHLRA